MADHVERIRIEADGKQAKSEAGAVEKRLGRMFDRSALKAAAFNQALALSTRAMSELGNAVRQGFRDAIEYEKTTNRLRAALKVTGHEVDNNVRALNAQSAVLQYQIGVSDEIIRRQQAMAISFGVSADKATDFVKAANVMAKMTGQELKESMRALLQAQRGVLTETSRLVPAFAQLSREELASAGAAKLLLENYGDLLTADMEGTAGSVERLALAWGDVAESFAQLALAAKVPTLLDNMTEAVRGVASTLERVKDLEPGAILRTYLGALTAPLEVGMAAFGIESPLAILSGGGSGAPPPTGPTGGDDEGVFDFKGEDGVSPGTIDWDDGGRGEKPRFQKMSGGYGVSNTGERADDLVYDPLLGFVSKQNMLDAINLRYEVEAEADERIAARTESKYQYASDLEKKRTAEYVALAKERVKAEFDAAKATSDAVIQTTQTALGAIQAFADGGIVGALQFAAAMIASYGSQTIASGMAHEATAASLAVAPGMQPAAVALAAAAANEIAVGTAMVSGGMVASTGIGIGKKAASGGFDNWNLMTGTQGGDGSELFDVATAIVAEGGKGGKGGKAASGPGLFTPGAGGGSAVQGGGDRSVTIILQGPVYDGAQAGRAIAERLAQAKLQGLI